jgi:mannose-6-phosphate isomerase-like protein (cupin superfamily)
MAQLNDIAKQAVQNIYFRRVVATGKYSQIVIMSIKPNEDIGEEVHANSDQTLYLVSGSGKSVIEGEEAPYNSGDLVFVPAGTKHNFVNTDGSDLKIITVYAPAHHAENTMHMTKADAQADQNDQPPAQS